MTNLNEQMQPLIDQTIERLASNKFKQDPLLEKDWSLIASIVGSVQKRHGLILEATILKAIENSKNFTAWKEPKFRVSRQANTLTANVNRPKAKPDWLNLLGVELQYPSHDQDDVDQFLQIDCIAYNKETSSVTGLEIKRGYSHHDAGKKKAILRSALATRMLIKSYAEHQGFKVSYADFFILNFYKSDEFHNEISKTKDDLDTLFEPGILEQIESVNHYFRKEILQLISSDAESTKQPT